MKRLLPFRDSEGLAVALYNMAVCLITMNDFPRALATYQRAREMCVEHGMPLLVTQADYNIAYLYYLRGEYSRAIEMLRATREECEKNGDAYVLALCYFDLSEIYLELNLSTEARETAHEGYAPFSKAGDGLRGSQMPGLRSHGLQSAWQGPARAGIIRGGAAKVRAGEKSRVAVAY